GVTPKREATHLDVIFDRGLYTHGVTLTPEARVKLTAVGLQLQAHAKGINITVIGFTSDVPMPAGQLYRDNPSLALRRAVAAVEHLRMTTRLPAEIFSIAGVGEAQAPPPPNDTREHRAWNR